jgi:hypothetical protein
VLFASGVCLAIAIAWPRDWCFGADRAELIEGISDGTKTLAEVNLSLATRADLNWEENSGMVRSLYGLFTLLCAVTGLQVVAWALAVV